MRRSNRQIAAKLIVLVKPLSIYMLLAIVLGMLGFLCAIFIPILGGYAFLKTGGMNVALSFSTIFALIIVCAVLRGPLKYGEQLCNHFIAFKLLALIRDQVFQALRKLAPAKLETQEKGNLITIITSDIELLEVFYAHTISPVAIAILTSIVMMLFFLNLHPVFALVAFLAYLSVGVLIPFITSKFGTNIGSIYRKQAGDLSSYILDSLRGLGEVLQYGQGEKRLEGIRAHTEDLSKKQAQLKNIEGSSSAFTGAAILIFSLLMLITGVLLYQSGYVEIEKILVAFVAMISSFGPVIAISSLANNLTHTFAAGNRVLDILEESPATEEILKGTDTVFEDLSCNQVSFGYTDEKIIKNFDLKLNKGSTLGISGKSGSGKSTLLRLIMRFWDVDEGNIKITGCDLREVNTNNLRNLESFVTQETYLFNDTIENNIRIANLLASSEDIKKACIKASLHNFILTLPDGYQSNVGELGDSLSGGEKQRIGLARAFLHDAPLILLDEPTSNLDSLNEGIILKSLAEQTDEKTIILVSHRLSTMSIADQVVTMENGRKC